MTQMAYILTNKLLNDTSHTNKTETRFYQQSDHTRVSSLGQKAKCKAKKRAVALQQRPIVERHSLLRFAEQRISIGHKLGRVATGVQSSFTIGIFGSNRCWHFDQCILVAIVLNNVRN